MKTFRVLISLPCLCLLAFLATEKLLYGEDDAQYNTTEITEVSNNFNPASFVELPPYGNSNPSTVVIIIPKNCSKAEARRGRELAEQLESIGIPVVRWDRISFSIDSREAQQQLNFVMNGDIPIVLVGSKGKSNPRLREILVEYYALNPE
ncbi:MAG: hypothetical protein AAFR77_11770 [Cyanobacteria bacterium J06631_2]